MRPYCLCLFLIVCGCTSASAQTPAIAVITAVQHTNLQGLPLSTGSTIYSGETLTAEKDGFIRLQADRVRFLLPAKSSARFLRSSDRLVVELLSGTLVYSATPGAQPFSIYADDVRLNPSGSGLTVGQIEASSGCAVSVFVKHGQLEISFDKNSRIVHAGETYPLRPDVGVRYGEAPSGNVMNVASPLSPDPEFLSPHSHVACPVDPPKPAGKPPGAEKAVVGGIAVITGIVSYLALESPDSPCSVPAPCHDRTK